MVTCSFPKVTFRSNPKATRSNSAKSSCSRWLLALDFWPPAYVPTRLRTDFQQLHRSGADRSRLVGATRDQAAVRLAHTASKTHAHCLATGNRAVGCRCTLAADVDQDRTQSAAQLVCCLARYQPQ